MADERVTLTHPGGAEVEIDAETLKRFEALPENLAGIKRRKWTPQEDVLLVKYWTKCHKDQIAQMFGVSANTARKRYRELTSGDNL